MDKKESDNLFKVTYTTNKAKQQVKVKFAPKLDHITEENAQTHFSTLLSGTHVAFNILLGGARLLRAPVQEETDAKIYIYKYPEEDNALLKQRKQLYGIMENVFSRILTELFPDVEYIEQCDKYQQELLFDMAEEEMAAYQQKIEEIKAIVMQMGVEPSESEQANENTSN